METRYCDVEDFAYHEYIHEEPGEEMPSDDVILEEPSDTEPLTEEDIPFD